MQDAMKQTAGREPRIGGCRLAAILVLVVLGAALVNSVAEAQLAEDRLSLLPARLTSGAGTVRLDGMGGFETAVYDENLEISLWDFANNPAGFADDRDAWNIELRYGHQEYAEQDSRTAGNDIKVNGGSFRGGFYRPGRVGAGAQLDYDEIKANDFAPGSEDFRIVGFIGTISTYLMRNLTVGVGGGLTGEQQNTFSPAVYNISHDNSTLKVDVGAAYHVARGVSVGARGSFFKTQLNGTSSGDYHSDTFDWSRPGKLGSFHAIVNRGRLRGGVDYSTGKVEGEESVRISWSERFVYNPTIGYVSMTLDTFTEDRSSNDLRTRWWVDVVPQRFAVSLATSNGDQSFKVASNPNAIGSLSRENVDVTTSAVIGGANWRVLADRLLLAAELKRGKNEVAQAEEVGTLTNTLTETVLRVGGEYFLGETIVGRLGLIQERQKYEFDTAADLDGSYNRSRLAAGMGVVPAGGIWQFDMALDLELSSDLGGRQTGLSAYVRHLF